MQLAELQQDFANYKASIRGAVHGLEPETVLVIEIAGSVEGFMQAVEATDGLEWLGELDIEDEPDEEFYTTNSKGEKADKQVAGRLFLSLSNEQGLRELLALWGSWEKNRALPRGKTKWRDVFAQTRKIRRWGIEETLQETGMIDRWHDLLDPVHPAHEIHCQIELFYRRDPQKRKQTERLITALLAEMGGRTLSPFIDMPDIAFHAVKAKLPAEKVSHLLELLKLPAGETQLDIKLFQFPGVMYFRPTGQSLVVSGSGAELGETSQFPTGSPELPPCAAILDGAPNLQHLALKDRLIFDDPDNLMAKYQPGERRHGTSMASLVVHGEQPNGQSAPLTRKVYHLAIMEPNPQARSFNMHEEHFPDDVFFEDRIERALRHMFEDIKNTPAQANTVKIINLSICDPERPFIRTPSPWARLLDWLSWKYRVLFCVSAGNFAGDIELGVSHGEFSSLSDEQKVTHLVKCVGRQLPERRLLSPAESINALTIGALNSDESGAYTLGQRINLLPNNSLFSTISRFGHGFRRSVKPEILFPGGRQLYTTPYLSTDRQYSVAVQLVPPGQKVAWDSAQEGELSQIVYTRGTSNAAALATRGGAQIYEALAQLQSEEGEAIPDELTAVLIKTLLVHGAQHDDQTEETLSKALKNPLNSRRFKEVIARYVGYGAVNIERVLACTEQRGTVLGCGEISENQVHEYRFPLPIGLSGGEVWRRMVITLGWFSPLNPTHRNLREAKLELHPGGGWDKVPLRLKRAASDHNQVLRGTVQHEVLEGRDRIAVYQEDGHILLHVTCKRDATERLDQSIPYGLAVTLEVAQGVSIPIYQQIRTRIRPQIPVEASIENA